MNPTSPFIAIEGVIGVGKTTLTHLLAERLGGSVVLEAVDENPFLESFYSDRARYAFQTQLFFLLSRFRQQMGLVQRDLFSGAVVSDYLFQKDRIFASINLADDEMELYDQILPLLEKELPMPERVVYLRGDLSVVLDRIERRGRSFEKDIDPAYLETLREAYDYFFFHFDAAPVLVVNTDHLNVVENPEHADQLVERILSHHKGTAYYNPV